MFCKCVEGCCFLIGSTLPEVAALKCQSKHLDHPLVATCKEPRLSVSLHKRFFWVTGSRLSLSGGLTLTPDWVRSHG